LDIAIYAEIDSAPALGMVARASGWLWHPATGRFVWDYDGARMAFLDPDLVGELIGELSAEPGGRFWPIVCAELNEPDLAGAREVSAALARGPRDGWTLLTLPEPRDARAERERWGWLR
jgi:hypothetical protein